VLAHQSVNVRRFGRERYTSTELDLTGNTIWRLLREAERAESGEGGEDRPNDDQASDLDQPGPVTLTI
jgi:hypothetical protein